MEVCAVFCYCDLVARCIETIYVCIWCMLACMSVVVTVWGISGNVCCVEAVV